MKRMLLRATLLTLTILSGPSPCRGQEAAVTEEEHRALLSAARQHLVVVTDAPGEIRGRLVRVEEGEGGWHPVGAAVPVVVGRSGVGPKREGDGRSPQGVFPLGRAFGYSPDPPPGVTYPYEPQASGAVCVDDVASLRYNRVFDADTLAVARDWSSAEAMRRDLAHGDDLYEWGVVVRYNDEGVPGAGSCIFLHVWRREDSPTAGCTAMAKGDLLEVLAWLEWAGSGGPVLVQGTRSYLESLRREGVLPYPPPG